MAASPDLDRLERRVMFAMDFRDPVTRLTVSNGLKVTAKGLGPPFRAPSGLFVWFDRDPPAKRDVEVTAISTDRRFLDVTEVITAPKHVDDIPVADLRMTHVLQATGLYVPPDGMTGLAGWLVEDGNKAPVPDAEVSLCFRHTQTHVFESGYKAVTDADGRFVAVANDLGDVAPDPAPPGSDAGIVGWLAVRRGNEVKYSAFQPLRLARLAWVPTPFLWTGLGAAPPQ
jgi:hypothetical protein